VRNLNIDNLNLEFAITDQLSFVEGRGGFVCINIKNRYAHALISTYAGQVLSWHPVTEAHDVLFVSRKSFYEPGKAVKGGIPICWPWFGSDPEGLGRGSHGFVRNRQWQITKTEILDNGAIAVTMKADISDIPLEIWPYQCELEICIEISDSLKVTLLTRNTGQDTMPLTQALHTYFKVKDIGAVSVSGLDQLSYIDCVDEKRQKKQSGIVQIKSEVDRIYTDVGSSLIIDDASLNRKINIKTRGSRSAIVWNPWMNKSKAMPDFCDDEYQEMLCVETANAGTDLIVLEPGAQCVLSASYSLE
jgi:glucose-6-phosphate 1-epimerase